MVGASYRVYDAYDPKLREGAISPKPEVVIKREGISLGLAWMFGLCTAAVNNSISRKLGLQDKIAIGQLFHQRYRQRHGRRCFSADFLSRTERQKCR